jgi:hypothetical protein
MVSLYISVIDGIDGIDAEIALFPSRSHLS